MAEIDLLLGLLPAQKFRRKDQFCYGVAKCSPREFSSKFSTQISELFCAYLKLQFANCSDLGSIGKKLSS